MDYSEIASVSGKGGLFKVVNPTRAGVILESLDDQKKKIVVGAQTKVSVLSDISIYTTDGEGAVPLEDIFIKIHKEFDGDTGLDKNSDPDELKAFLQHVLPTYDEDRVYVSDIKKLVTWYNVLAKELPEILKEKKEEEPKAKPKKEAKASEKKEEAEKDEKEPKPKAKSEGSKTTKKPASKKKDE